MVHKRDIFIENFIELILFNYFSINYDENIQKDFKMNYKNCDIMLTIKPKIAKMNKKYNVNLKLNNDNTYSYSFTYDIHSISNEENKTNDSLSSISKELNKFQK